MDPRESRVSPQGKRTLTDGKRLGPVVLAADGSSGVARVILLQWDPVQLAMFMGGFMGGFGWRENEQRGFC